MKYDLNLSRAENLDAWRKHRINNPGPKYAELGQEEKSSLGKLNEQLRLIGQRHHREAMRLCEVLDRRISDPLDWLQEYSVALKISLYLRDDDPEYDVNGDNILWIMEELLSLEGSLLDWGATRDINTLDRDWYGFDKNEEHCYLYRALYSFWQLRWHDLLRIGIIFVELVVTHYDCCKISRNDAPP
jgi:hypothetical protein